MEFHSTALQSGNAHMSLTANQAKMLIAVHIAFKCDVCGFLHITPGNTWENVDAALAAYAWGKEWK